MSRSWLRIAVFVLAGIEAVLFLAFASLMLQSSDPLGRAIGQGMATLMAIPVAALVVPALVMAAINRWLPLALGLSLLALPVAAYLWAYA
jgi:hypothetical protein